MGVHSRLFAFSSAFKTSDFSTFTAISVSISLFHYLRAYMPSLNDHWDSIFSEKNDEQLGWYEKDVTQTLKFIHMIPDRENSTVFLPGAGTSQLALNLFADGYKLILNDISKKALEKLESHMGTNDRTIWLHHDISKPLPDNLPSVQIWIDRAVLHFLTDEKAIDGYFSNLKQALDPGGHVLLAEFSSHGASQCAGLDLHRYSIEEMTDRLGPDFQLIRHEEYTYTNPSGGKRPYIYALFKQIL